MKSISFPPPGDAVWLEEALCSAGFIRELHCFPARPLASLLQRALKSSSSLLQLAPCFCVRVDLAYPRSSLC